MNFYLGKITDFIYLLKQGIADAFTAIFAVVILRLYLGTAIIINLAAWFFTFFIKNRISADSAVLHYNIDFGVNLIGTANQLFTIPFLGFLILIANLLVIHIITKKKADKFLVHLLAGSACVANLFLLVSLSFLYLINSR